MQYRRTALFMATCLALTSVFTLGGCLPSDAEIESDMAYERRAAYLDWKAQRERGEATSARVDGPLSIDDAIKIALQYNKNLQMYMQDRDIARGQRIAAWDVALPSVLVSGDATLTERTRMNDGRRTNLDSYGTSVKVTQPLFQGEAIPAAIRRSRFFTALTDETIRETIQQLIADVASSYYDVLLAQHLLDTNLVAVESAREQLRVVTEKRRQETATDYDVLRAQVDVASYSADMLSQQNQIDTSRVALLKYMGVSQDSEITFSDSLEFLPMRPVFERAVEIASGLRPDLRQAELTARMNDEAVKIQRSAFFPAVGAMFQQGWSDSNEHTSFSRNRWSTGLTATWDLGIDNVGNLEEAKANARKSRIDILNREEDMLREIRQQMNTLANAEEVVRALEVNRTASEEALRLVEIGYQAGVRTELDVQDARKARTDVLAQYYTALADHTKARLNLQLAMGVLGPQRVDSGQPRGPSVPIANIQEFAATDYEPLTSESFLNTPLPSPQTTPVAPSGNTAPRVTTQPTSYNEPARSATPAPNATAFSATANESLPLEGLPMSSAPVRSAGAVPEGEEFFMLAPPPSESGQMAMSQVESATVVNTVNNVPTPPSAPETPAEPEAAPLFKVKVRGGTQSGS